MVVMDGQQQSSEPVEVTVTVLSARNLYSKRKGETVQASVVFGIGKELYSTEMIESATPEWNQEAVIHVGNYPSKSMKFKVRDKKNVLGVVRIKPFNLLQQSGTRWYHLQPYHSKSQEVLGELQLDCWISKFKSIPDIFDDEGHSHVTGQRVRSLLYRSALTTSFRKKKVKSAKIALEDNGETPGGSPATLRAPKALSGAMLMSGGSPVPSASPTPTLPFNHKLCNNLATSEVSLDRPETMTFHSDSSVSLRTEDRVVLHEGEEPAGTINGSAKPEVTGVSPNECFLDGGHRIIIRGNNLGDSKTEVVKVTLSDIDCTDSLEYFSSNKLAITTPPVPVPCEGPILVQTIHGIGGPGPTFSFKALDSSGGPKGTNRESFFGGKRKSKGNSIEELMTENRALKQLVKELQDENAQLKIDYYSMKANRDVLLTDVIEKTPFLLEVKLTPQPV